MGFRPKYTLEDGIEQVKQAFASGAVTDMKDPHSNVQFLTEGGMEKVVRRVYGSVLEDLDPLT